MAKLYGVEFKPDLSHETIFPWEDLKARFKYILKSNDFKNHKSCPKCGKVSENLIWINFSSPSWTWEHLCGREGPLSICPDCCIQVEFIIYMIN
jgi:hypothetical protein